MRAWTFAACMTVAAATASVGAAPLAGQAELDRIVARVNNRIITQSDVRQAALLGLVDEGSSDEAVRRGLENRLLILTEIARSAPLLPTTDDDLAARRAEWNTRVGGPARARRLLTEAAMSDAGLQAWLRDDLRIRVYLDRQFGNVPGAERPRAIAEWLARLRQRAGLK
jgi:hypothetical protein